jgi:hypothetical protein
MAFGRGSGKRSDRVAHYRAPGRRLGALVEGLSHGPDGIATRKTTRSAKHAQNRCWGRAQKGAHTPVSGTPESMSMGAVGSNRWLLGTDVGPSVAAVVARGLSGPGVTSNGDDRRLGTAASSRILFRRAGWWWRNQVSRRSTFDTPAPRTVWAGRRT